MYWDALLLLAEWANGKFFWDSGYKEGDRYGSIEIGEATTVHTVTTHKVCRRQDIVLGLSVHSVWGWGRGVAAVRGSFLFVCPSIPRMDKRPRTSTGCQITSPSAEIGHMLGNGYRHHSVAFTAREIRNLRELYQFEEGVSETGPSAELIQAGDTRNVCRHAEADGLRLMGWIARYCRPGEDPVKVVGRLFLEAGNVEIAPEDVGWLQEECEDDNDND